jgi:hypothetical protein
MTTKQSVFLIEMKSRPTMIVAVLAAVLSFALIDPFRIASGTYDPSPYRDIGDEIDKSTTSGVLAIASYADFYKFPVFRYLRDVLGTRLAYHGENTVEYGYDIVLAQASLGQENFLRYLRSRDVSHLIIPTDTADTGFVYHRWSTHGTINLDLNSRAFTLVRESNGDFPLALYKINFGDQLEPISTPPLYRLDWSGVRPEFYSLLRFIDERYKVSSFRRYEERIDTAWVFNGEQLEVELSSPDTPEQDFVIEMQFIAAYGEKAPIQVLRISMENQIQVVTLKPGQVNAVSFIIRNGQSIKVEDVLGCRKGTSFAPEDNDGREFCFGLRDVEVRSMNYSEG